MPQYDQEQVEVLVLEIGAELHPRNLPLGEMISKVATDEGDRRERKTIEQAVGRLRGLDLLRERSDDAVELTPGGLRAVAFLSGP